ncbi:GNAT family N-acetyltransferase (plasmid) [Pantoea agglomerans]|uniref:GNAT family N-acetyltransferase n=1 Tax=Enterobacter agglomerans TaxID=549 RepID=UPI00178679B8|nr:GNAT family N-acetyltransferase [Pantoea agglomerans]
MKAFTVRRINESDLEDFRRVRLEALLLHPDAFGASYEDWNQKPASFFAEKLRINYVFGGFDLHNTIQGLIGLSFSTSSKLNHVATIWGMYVRAGMRRSGLSSGLMEAALEAASSVRTIKLSVVTTNHAAYSLYRSYGFTNWATDTAALYANGIFHDEYLMRRDSENDS